MSLNRFTIQAGFVSITDVEKTKKVLISEGIEKSDIDYITFPKAKGKGLAFKTDDKRALYGFRLFLVGSALGLVLYILSALSGETPFFGNQPLMMFWGKLILSSLALGGGMMLVGYMIGRKVPRYEVVFNEDDDNSENIILAVNLPFAHLEKVKNILIKANHTFVDVLDRKKEREIGI